MRTNIKKNNIKHEKTTNQINIVKRVTARVVSLDFGERKIILDSFGQRAYCSFEDVGYMKFQDISRIFKPKSVHTFCKKETDNKTDLICLDYQKVHPETMKPGKISIASTWCGCKNLKKFLFDLLEGEEKNEKNSNDFS